MFGFSVGPWELILILAVVLIIFGPGKLPEVGKSLGNGIREFRKEKHEFVRSLIKKSRAIYNWHNIETSFLEACFARGDRDMAAVLEGAFLRGCRFDGWTAPSADEEGSHSGMHLH
jgi:sec-independent protein translocase protein TatA